MGLEWPPALVVAVIGSVDQAAMVASLVSRGLFPMGPHRLLGLILVVSALLSVSIRVAFQVH